MRSVVVVLPASMWAMIPMFRVRASGYSRMTRGLLPPPVRLTVSRAACATFTSLAAVATPLPPVVGERLVRFRHLVHVLASLDRRSLARRRVQQLRRQAVGHGVLAPLPGVVDQPPQGQRGASVGPNLHRNLIGGPADP